MMQFTETSSQVILNHPMLFIHTVIVQQGPRYLWLEAHCLWVYMATMQASGNSMHRNTPICFYIVVSWFCYFSFWLTLLVPTRIVRMARWVQLVFILVLNVDWTIAKKKSVVDYDEKDVQRVYKEWLVSEWRRRLTLENYVHVFNRKTTKSWREMK